MTIKDISRAIRTRQWAKNALLFGGFLFAGGLRAPKATLWFQLELVLLAFGCFCALSGAAYLINDWQDLERDRHHPTKKNRPLASGRISLRGAAFLFVILVGIALGAAAFLLVLQPLARGFAFAAASYFALTLAYSLYLKHEVIIDVLSVAAGFVVRVVAGCLALPVQISPWILFCTFNLALFVALCKRRAELLELENSAQTRRVLQGYTPAMLDTFIAIAAGLTIISYSLYTFDAPNSLALGGSFGGAPRLMTSIPFVVYGVFRYLLIAHSSPVGGEPEQMLRDKPLMTSVLLWGVWVALLTILPSH
ncbi:UbiA prenyltransferase family protein [Abditibacterium utsteinense]|uniref:UbiA prenyltransferase family protein n=1 Tax=Abditibacterium utsteinense TaxID=1960156 RepID=A0A2S8SP24_9BACT|nr:UbiA prenyltransferase family protein [Abditibacterium utsteinense]